MSLSSNQRIICWRLSTGKAINYNDMINALYNPDNECNDPIGLIKVIICRLRKKAPCRINKGSLGYYIKTNELEKFKDWLVEETLKPLEKNHERPRKYSFHI